MSETPIVIDQAWADGWAARMAAARAEIARRLEVCEAQRSGPWRVRTYGEPYDGGFGIEDPDGAIVTERWDMRPGEFRDSVKAGAPAIAAQRTERPQELRTLAALLDMLDAMSCWLGGESGPALAERGLRIVEEALCLPR